MTPASIPPFRYTFRDQDIDYITEEIGQLLRTHGHLTMATHGQKLEEEFATYAGVESAVAVANGTSALEIILRSLDVSGGTVIVPTNTFGATVVAVLRAGAVPLFADAGEDLCVSVEDVERKLSPDVRAVITVHIGGLISPDTERLARLCTANRVPLVEDAAHAIGATLHGRAAGTFGVAAAYSLFSTKVMTAGEGGLIATNDPRIRDEARLLRDHAKNVDGTMSTTGYNWRLTEFQAIVARAQLRRLDEMIRIRGEAAAIYDELLAGTPGTTLLTPPASVRHNRYKYVIFLEHHEPEQLRTRIATEHRIQLGGYVYRTPCHRQGAFTKFVTSDLPAADRLCSSHICPPIFPDMTKAEVEHVARSLRAVLSTSGAA